MRKILIIKTSSLGDIVHNFPVITDIRGHFPSASIDWVVEESYISLVKLHPGVRRGIPVALRRWRRKPFGRDTWNEVGTLRRLFNEEFYDAVIDTQGLVKSALLTSVINGRRHGFDAASARERIAARFYDVRHYVPRDQHAVVRNRELAARALGYRISDVVDYGLADSVADRHRHSRREIVLLHSTSRADKLWAEANWIELGQLIESAGGRVILPWGGEIERMRSGRIAAALSHASIPGALSIDAVAILFASCNGVVGLDTGLTHLAAALNTPVVAIYCATDPRLTGVYGAKCAINMGASDGPPRPSSVLQALRENGAL